ncbi:hypothetical protein L204_100801 [Cryptococcus depauperatus]
MSSLALPIHPSSLSNSISLKTQQALDREALDEADDVDDSDLLAIPRAGKQTHGVDMEDEGEGDKEDEDEEGPDVEIGLEAGGGLGGISLSTGGKAKGKKKNFGQEIEEKGKKRRADTFLLRGHMDDDQAKRFETFSTIAINKNAIKRLNRELYDQHCSPQLSQIVAGMAKIFVADVIELAKDLQPHSAHPKGPLQPYHLKLAKACLQEKGIVGSIVKAKQLPVVGFYSVLSHIARPLQVVLHKHTIHEATS